VIHKQGIKGQLFIVQPKNIGSLFQRIKPAKAISGLFLGSFSAVMAQLAVHLWQVGAKCAKFPPKRQDYRVYIYKLVVI